MKIEDYLTKHVTEEQKQRTLNLISGLSDDATEAEKFATNVSAFRPFFYYLFSVNQLVMLIVLKIFQELSGQYIVEYIHSSCERDE